MYTRHSPTRDKLILHPLMQLQEEPKQRTETGAESPQSSASSGKRRRLDSTTLAILTAQASPIQRPLQAQGRSSTSSSTAAISRSKQTGSNTDGGRLPSGEVSAREKANAYSRGLVSNTPAASTSSKIMTTKVTASVVSNPHNTRSTGSTENPSRLIEKGEQSNSTTDAGVLRVKGEDWRVYVVGVLTNFF
eukprot:Lankesteria_metandrocarpae@DN1412_c1_g1_i1.p1